MTQIHPDAEARLADALNARIPPSAVTLSGGGLRAIAWASHGGWADEPDPDPTTWEALWLQEGSARYGAFSGQPVGIPALLAPRDDGPGRRAVSHVLRDPPGGEAPVPGPGRRSILSDIAAVVDAGAYLAMLRAGVSGPACRSLLASHERHAEGLRAFASEYPWLVAAAAETAPAEARTAAAGGAEAVAVATIRKMLGEGHPDHRPLLAASRGLVLPMFSVGAAEPANVAALLALPAEALPPPPDADPRSDAQQGWLALYVLAPTLAALAHVSGRPAVSISGRPGDWAATARMLARRADLDSAPDDFPYDWGAILAGDSMCNVTDMIRAFAEEVLAPALGMRDGELPPPVPHLRQVAPLMDDMLAAASARLLLGGRTLPALAEVCARWHARSDAAARFLAGLAGPDAPAGPRLFDDVDLGDGLYLTCLNTVGALLDEGAPGPDAAGVDGLHHCVGGYGELVSTGRTSVASLRRRTGRGTFERLSTAEVDWSAHPYDLVQHQGPRNTDPPPWQEEALNRGLGEVADDARAAHAAHRPPEGGWPRSAGLVVRADAWEAIRDLWAFALPRPLRTLGPSELLAEARLA